MFVVWRKLNSVLIVACCGVFCVEVCDVLFVVFRLLCVVCCLLYVVCYAFLFFLMCFNNRLPFVVRCFLRIDWCVLFRVS